MIGCAVGGQDSEGNIFLAAPLDLARGADAGAVAIQQHGQQHPGRIGGPAVPIGSIGLEEWAEVDLVDDVEDEPGQVIGPGSHSRTSGGSKNAWSRSQARKL